MICYDIIRREAIPRLVPQAYRRFDLSGGGSPMFPYPSEKGSPRERDPAPRVTFPPAINIGRLYINWTIWRKPDGSLRNSLGLLGTTYLITFSYLIDRHLP